MSQTATGPIVSRVTSWYTGGRRYVFYTITSLKYHPCNLFSHLNLTMFNMDGIWLFGSAFSSHYLVFHSSLSQVIQSLGQDDPTKLSDINVKLSESIEGSCRPFVKRRMNSNELMRNIWIMPADLWMSIPSFEASAYRSSLCSYSNLFFGP